MSYSPWSDGTCERHNQFITNMLHKISDDKKCSYKTALAWAINGKNGLINNNRFSPGQLLFGHYSNLPNTLVNHLPAPDKTVYSSDLASHIHALHSARQALVALESSNKMCQSKRIFVITSSFIILAIWFIINMIHHMSGKVLLKSWDKMVLYYFSVTMQNTSKLTFVMFN